jgi:methylated-DNA-[protein]-cysteine S-methyltransferase
MAERGLTIFEAAIGTCAIVWSARGIAGVQLPETTELATRARLQRRFPDAEEAPPPPFVERAIEAIVALLRGEARDLRDIPLDLDEVPEFNKRVYDIARTIPPGRTMTYGEIAKQLGDLLFARAVGQALGHNPVPLIVPCHRVVAASGKSGGFSAGGGVVTKLRLLTIENAQPTGPTLFDRLPLEARATRR